MFDRSECTENETDRQADDADPGRQREANAETVSKRCDHCGGPIDTDEWYPAATRRDDDGDVKVYNFCDEECRVEWERENAND